MWTPLQRLLINHLQTDDETSIAGYTVPGPWVGQESPATFFSGSAYLAFQLQRIRAIQESRTSEIPDQPQLIYNASVRHVTSYEHGEQRKRAGWRNTGTFLKLIGLLPYLHSLGVTTLSLLPITEIGTVGKKGTLGSPYAVKHPLHLDPSLAEPVIPMSVDDQARVLIETCHSIGIRVVVEFALRTASIDSTLIAQHPEWFYWVDAERVANQGGFRAPAYPPEVLAAIESTVDSGQRTGLPEPLDSYRDLFAMPPFRVEHVYDGWLGYDAMQRRVRVPHAFADWPVNDVQPPWTDVTYLKLHEHPSFNYVAYNTIRMFDANLDQHPYRQRPLWNTIAGIIPTFIRLYNIDGAVVDMGHALPHDLVQSLISEARRTRPEFFFVAENFVIDVDSVRQGYDAVVGPLPLLASDTAKIRQFVEDVSVRRPPQHFLATAETHNTPRVCAKLGGPAHGHGLWFFLQGLPKGIGFIHAGMELGETTPVNTGLGFTDEERLQWRAEDVALFSDVRLEWDLGSSLVDVFRRKLAEFYALHVVRCFSPLDRIDLISSRDDVLSYLRWTDEGDLGAIFCWNSTTELIDWKSILPLRVQAVAVQYGVALCKQDLSVRLEAGEARIIPVYGAFQRAQQQTHDGETTCS